MKPNTFVIGDIHGDLKALDALMKSLAPEKGDKLVFLGDFIDRGPQTKEVIEYLMRLQSAFDCVFIRGNHEDALLAQLESNHLNFYWHTHGGKETLVSYGVRSIDELRKNIPASHLEFLKNTVDYYETPTHVFVHASYDPTKPSDEQTIATLRYTFMQVARPVPDFDKEVVCGHSSLVTGRPARKGHLLCIDTLEYGWLTAYEINSGRFIQANNKGQRRELSQACMFSEKRHVPKQFWRNCR